MLARIIMVVGTAAAVSVWIYELWHWGTATWEALPFHQVLAWTGTLPRSTYIWAYCSTQAAEARAAIPFCVDVSTASPALGKVVWFYLGSEAGMIIALNTVVLMTIASMFGGRSRVVQERRRAQPWPEEPAPPAE